MQDSPRKKAKAKEDLLANICGTRQPVHNHCIGHHLVNVRMIWLGTRVAVVRMVSIHKDLHVPSVDVPYFNTIPLFTGLSFRKVMGKVISFLSGNAKNGWSQQCCMVPEAFPLDTAVYYQTSPYWSISWQSTKTVGCTTTRTQQWCAVGSATT